MTAMELDVITILLSVLLVFISFLVIRNNRKDRRRFVALINKIPGPPTIPLLGNSLEEMVPRNRIMDVIKERHEKYAPIYRTWVGGNGDVHLTKPEHIEIFLSSSKHIEKAWSYSLFYPWLGLGLFTSKGEKWRPRRKLITPTFHFSILEQFFEVFVEKSEVMIEKLMAEVVAKGGDSFDVQPFIGRCTLDIICRTAMGTDIHAQEDTESEYVHAVADISEVIVARAIRPHLHSDFIFKRTARGKKYYHCLEVLHGFSNKVIKERKEEHAKKRTVETTDEDLYGKKRMAFLDLLIEASYNDDKLTDVDLREEVDTFMFGGHDTTAFGITWALFLLGANPKIQEKVVEELDAIFEGDFERRITMRDINEMKYLERVIKETLRLYPSAPFIARELLEDTQCGEYLLPAGCSIVIHIFHVHRNADYFPNPEEFDPDRFLPERAQGRHPYAYIPFSAGPRNCIGQKFAMLEEKTMLASILRRFQIRSVEKRENITLISEIILRPESGMHMVFTPRSQIPTK